MPYYPTYDQFLDTAEPGKLVTIFREFPNDCLLPINAFYSLYSDRESFLFESASGSEHESRYSFIGTDPFLHFEAYGTPEPRARATFSRSRDLARRLGEPTLPGEWLEDGHYCGEGGPMGALRSLLRAYPAVVDPRLPRFCGGAVGYIGYDAIRFVEHLPNAPRDDRHLPDMALDFYDTIVVFDHAKHTVAVTAHVRVDEGFAPKEARREGSVLRKRYEAACERIASVAQKLTRPQALKLAEIPKELTLHRGFDTSNFETPARSARTRYEEGVRKCKRYIVEGDIFQVVVSQRFETSTFASPLSIYRALWHINPSPYMFYLRAAHSCLVGSSPELMLRVEEGEVTVRPLAGTRPRGNTAQRDEELADELRADEKERAEHVMLVDLGRNDAGRVSQYGTVQLDKLMVIERYSHVMHLSSTVTGRLREGMTALDAMEACLPAGTVSGAPKIRAMEIIDELEPTRRGPYAGAVGFIDFTGNLETCLALRMMVFNESKRPGEDSPKASGSRTVHIQAGAGLVADSVPAREYDETVNKAKAVLKAIEVAEAWRYPMGESEKTVLSCIQPTADMHVGNYFGAVKNWVELQERHRCYFGVVDLHAMTRPYSPDELRENSRRMFVDLLACGIDPKKAVLFVQSTIPEHTELCWILSCFCSYGELSRMTQFKEKSGVIEAGKKKEEFVSAGLLVYPVLQAADILLYRASYVPVGKDQEQHLELARAIAGRFNQRFNTNYLPEPQPLFSETPKIMSLVNPESKMSKSDVGAAERGCVGLFEEEKSVRKKVRSAVTDTGPREETMSPGVENLFGILRACGKDDIYQAMHREYDAGSLKYVALKDAVADALVELTGRLRTRRREIEADRATVDEQLCEMTEKARTLARETLREVRRLAGLPTFG